MLEEKALHYRKRIMEVGYKTQSGHLSSALSCVEILTALYDGGILKFDTSYPEDENRDRFILSKGHACIIQYIILNEKGLITDRDLYNFCKPHALLGAHPDANKISGIDASTGSLGHGLAFGMGTALAAKHLQKAYHTYVVIGDGESQEGTIWESALCIGHHKLNNLTVLIDYNQLQASGMVADISGLDPLADKWKAFGFDVYEINGNDMKAVVDVLSAPIGDKPRAIICNTIKGKGVDMIEGKNGWHGRKPNDAEWQIISKTMEI